MFRLSLVLCLIARFCVSQNWVNYNLNGPFTKLYYSQSLNKLIFGGQFNQVEGKYIPGVATFDGVSFDTLGPGINWSLSAANIKSFAEYKGNLYMGGGFSYLGNTHAFCIAKWNGIKWDSLGVQLNGPVQAMKVYNNELYIGGGFFKCGAQTAYAVIKYDGTSWIPVGNGVPFITPGSYPKVFDFDFLNGNMYLAGEFYDSSGNQFHLAKFDGTNWSKVLELQSSLAEINTVKVYNNALYIGGRFYKSSGDPGNLIAKFDGINWNSLANGINASFSTPSITELKVYNNKLYITGGFNNVNGNIASSIAYWNDTSLCALNLGNQPVKFLSLEYYNNAIYTGTSYYPLGSVDTVKFFANIIPSSLNFNCSIVDGISEKNNSHYINMFPNPTSSTLNITDEQNQFQNSTINIKNTLGQIILSSPFKPEIDVSQLSNGVYFFQIRTEDKRFMNAKFIKQ